MPRVCILGLDCLAPDLVFGRFWDDLPHLRALAQDGTAGPLRSCHPPITVPAWAALVTGVDPGVLGVYGFHDRADRSYHRRRLASSLSYHQPPLWTLLSHAGLSSRVLAVPQTYPPQPLKGCMLTGCLTPTSHPFATHPAHIATSIAHTMGEARVDVDNFRHLKPGALLQEVRRNSRALFALAHQWLAQDDWHLFMMVDMGPDRLQHALWHLCMDDHPDYVAGHPLQYALRDYYMLLDKLVGRCLNHSRSDDLVMVVSDHGAQAMQGAIALNTWLMQQGYLVLKPEHKPHQVAPFNAQHVDWSRTLAWADGGYAARIYLNVQGREPEGIVPEAQRPQLLSQLTAALHTLPGGPHTVLQPQNVYAATHGIAPDLLVYLGNLRQRALGTWGHSAVQVRHNDGGPDGANHAHDGVLIWRDGQGCRPSAPASIYDIAPTVLHHLGVPTPHTMLGTDLSSGSATERQCNTNAARA